MTDDLPYRRLWAAVFHMGLADAAAAYKTKMTLKHNKPDAALDWLWSNDNFPGSFVWLCDMFGLAPDTARTMWRMKVRMLASKAEI